MWNIGTQKKRGITMENKEEKPVQTNEAFEAYKKAVSKLKDGPFKDFYQNNPDEMQRLFNTVDIKDLKRFNKNIFSLTDIWSCLYIASHEKNLNFTTELFNEIILSSLSEKLKKKDNKVNEANKSNKVFEEYEEAVDKLADAPFKDFYQKNPKEMEYLFNNVDIKDLKKFDKSRFSLVDIWGCLSASHEKNFNFTIKEFNVMIVSPLLTKANKLFEKYEETVGELEDGPFKEFYQNNPQEMKYLSKKVKIHELTDFAGSIFSLTDIWSCLYIKSFKKSYNITTSKFKKKVLKKALKMEGDEVDSENIDEIYMLRKYSIGYIEVYASKKKPSQGNRKKFPLYTSFIRTKNRELDKVLEYAFNDAEMRGKFKNGKCYQFSPIEAMFVFFIFDDKYKENIKHIKSGKGYLVKRRFMNGLHRYASAICEARNLSNEGVANSLNEIYEERIDMRCSDLATIYGRMKEALDEYKKGEEADIEKVIEVSKICIKKLKKFIKIIDLSIDKSTKSTTDTKD